MSGLRIKYGLGGNEPTAEQEVKWLSRVQELMSQGQSEEQAGANAASEVFKTYETMKYASEAKTIKDLLLAIQTNHGK